MVKAAVIDASPTPAHPNLLGGGRGLDWIISSHRMLSFAPSLCFFMLIARLETSASASRMWTELRVSAILKQPRICSRANSAESPPGPVWPVSASQRPQAPCQGPFASLGTCGPRRLCATGALFTENRAAREGGRCLWPSGKRVSKTGLVCLTFRSTALVPWQGYASIDFPALRVEVLKRPIGMPI